VAVYDRKRGWIAKRGTRSEDSSLINTFFEEVFDRRIGQILPGCVEAGVVEVPLSKISHEEEEEDRQLPPNHLFVELSHLAYVLLGYALVEFGGYPVDAFSAGQIHIGKEKVGEAMEAYGKFHRVLESKKASLAEKFNDIDEFWSKSCGFTLLRT
jgi:hypothetical protein